MCLYVNYNGMCLYVNYNICGFRIGGNLKLAVNLLLAAVFH
jgi:hypothetical protein